MPNSVKNVRDDNFDSDDDPIVDTFFELSEEQKILIEQGETDTDTIVQIRVTVYYNEDSEKQFQGVEPKVMIMNFINEANEGFRRSFVPIKIVLHHYEKSPLTDEKLNKECLKAKSVGFYNEQTPEIGWYSSDQKVNDRKCTDALMRQFSKSKGKLGVKQGADLAVLLSMHIIHIYIPE